MKTKVEMPKSILNDKDNWRFVGTSYYMSGHMYRGTSMEAFETIDSCGNCDGARCDYCEKREIPAHWALAVESDKLYNALIADGVDEGVAVISVEKNTPAEKAGLKKGDIIVKINDQDVGSLAEFRYELYKHEVGEKVKLSFYRDGKVKTTTVTLTKNSNSES